MLLLDFDIKQDICNELIFKDITPKHSSDYVGGYDVLNVKANQIVWASVTLDFGLNRVYEISKAYNQTHGDWVIKASHIPFHESTDSGCSDCGTPCAGTPAGCEGCDDTQALEKDCNGFLTTFPEGCITIKYEVFSWDSTCKCNKSEGVKVKRIVSTCATEKLYYELADKLTLGDPKCYDFFNKKETRIQTISMMSLAKAKLDLLGSNPNVSCECVASEIKQIKDYLDSIKIQ